MRDELKGKRAGGDARGRTRGDECMVINIDHSSNEGTHWTCLFIKDGVSFYFDSFGFEPPLEVNQYLAHGKRFYTSFPIQKMNEVICGHYCIYVLYRLSNGAPGRTAGADFYAVCDELYRYSNEI